MSLIKCSECGKEISDKAAACPYCGCPVEISLSKIEKQAKSAKEEKPKAAFKPNYAMTIEEPKQKQSEGSFAFGIIIACVVLTLVITGIVAITSSGKTEQSMPSTSIQDTPKSELNVKEYAQSTIEDEKRRVEAEKQLKYEINELRKHLRSTVDTVENITWYHDKTSPRYISGNVIYCYMGESGSNYWLRVVYGFSKTDWVFMDSIILNIDGRIIRKKVRNNDRHTDVNNGIFEWVDWPVFSVEEDFLLSIANSKSTQIKFSGDNGAKSFTVSKQQKQALKNIITYYRLRVKLSEIQK